MLDVIITYLIVAAAFFMAFFKIYRTFSNMRHNTNKCAECQGCMLKKHIQKKETPVSKAV